MTVRRAACRWLLSHMSWPTGHLHEVRAAERRTAVNTSMAPVDDMTQAGIGGRDYLNATHSLSSNTA